MSLKKSCSCRFLVPVEIDHAFAGENRRHQVGQRLSGARSGLNDQVLFFGERARDRFRHLELAFAKFVVRMPLRKEALLAEELAYSERFGG